MIDVKIMGILPMHEGKMPLKCWGMLPSLSGPLGLGQAADTIVGGSTLQKGASDKQKMFRKTYNINRTRAKYAKNFILTQNISLFRVAFYVTCKNLLHYVTF